MPQLPFKTLKFKGKTYRYQRYDQFAKAANIDKAVAKKYVQDYNKGETTRFLVNDEGDFLKYDLSKKPLILQKFLEDKEGTKRIRNKRFINLKVSGYETLNNLSSATPLSITIKAKVKIRFSDEYIEKQFTYQDDIAPADVDDNQVREQAMIFYSIDNEDNVIVDNFEIVSTLTGQSIKIVDMFLRNNEPLKLTSLFNDIVYDNVGENNDCIYNYLHKIHPKSSNKKLRTLKTTSDILEYCKNKGVRMVAYDITGKVIAENHDVKSKGRYKNVNFIAYNNHLYPIRNATLEKIRPRKKYEVENHFVSDCWEELKRVVEVEKILPTNIKLDQAMDICSFNYVDKNDKYHLYINNPDYEKCKEILKSYGLLDQLTPFVNLKNIYKIIEKLYIKSFIDSFLPDNNQFIKGAFNYNNEKNVLELDELENINYTIDTIDKNKCYSWALRCLPFLISCDIKRFSNWSLYGGEKLISHNLYIARPEMSSILLPNTNIYCGEHLLFAKKEGLNFHVIEVLECTRHDNYYKAMIDDLVERTDMNSFKNIINVMIGKFERSQETLVNRKVTGICNEDQQKVDGGHYLDFNDEYKLKYEFEKDYCVLNRKPIAIQIKDQSRVILYNQLKACNLNTEDIIQIKTDSFTFINRGQDYSKYINNNIDGWKLESYKAIKTRKVIDKDRTFKYVNKLNYNRLFDCYAGCGKSTYIKNEIDNMYRSTHNEDYVILTPSHSTLKDYKKVGYNCNVIQKNTYFNNLPNENNVYVDEMGMMDTKAWNLIYMCYLDGKNIHAFGDFKQLLPVLENTTFNSKNFIDKVFSYKLNLEHNFRNNFTKEYYDKLINGYNPNGIVSGWDNGRNWLLEQVNIHNSCWTEAEVVIAYRNKTRAKWNNKIMKHKGFQDKYCVGIKIIATDNKLAKHNIFNKFEYTIKEVDGDKIIITDDIDDIEITRKDYDSHFDLGYCRTLYSVQGDTINSFFYPPEDYYFLDNRAVYTLISRLRQKLVKVPESYPPFDFKLAEIKYNFSKVLIEIKTRPKLRSPKGVNYSKSDEIDDELEETKVIKDNDVVNKNYGELATKSYSTLKELLETKILTQDDYDKILDMKTKKARPRWLDQI